MGTGTYQKNVAMGMAMDMVDYEDALAERKARDELSPPQCTVTGTARRDHSAPQYLSLKWAVHPTRIQPGLTPQPGPPTFPAKNIHLPPGASHARTARHLSDLAPPPASPLPLPQKYLFLNLAGCESVLEVGVGTGPNMTYYPSSVEEVVGVDTNEYMVRSLQVSRLFSAPPRALLRPGAVTATPHHARKDYTVSHRRANVSCAPFFPIAAPLRRGPRPARRKEVQVRQRGGGGHDERARQLGGRRRLHHRPLQRCASRDAAPSSSPLPQCCTAGLPSRLGPAAAGVPSALCLLCTLLRAVLTPVSPPPQ